MAAVLVGSFIGVERIARRPLVPLATWRIRSLTAGVAMMFAATGFMIGMIYLSSLYMQRSLGMSALEAGLVFVRLSLSVGIAAHLAPNALRAVGAKTSLSAALLTMAAGAALLAAAPDQASYATDLLPWLVVIGLGIGLAFVSIQVAAMSEVGEKTAGIASGLFTTGHEIGAAFGVAVFSAVAGWTGTGAVTGLGSGAGFDDGVTVAALLAAGLALVAAFAVPSFRLAQTANVSAH